jgi:hypothetical protein
MTLKVLLPAVLVVLGCVSRANADPVLLINGNGVLTGALNVEVAGTLYDVTFADGTCIAVFTGCDAASDFHFASSEDAIAAANALLGQVFLDAPSVGDFDTHPELTFGCTEPPFCFVAIPTGLTTAGGVVFGEAAFNAATLDVPTNFNFLTDYDTSVDTRAVWAKFTVAQPVPEPASLTLLGSSLAIVMLRRRRRTTAAVTPARAAR